MTAIDPMGLAEFGLRGAGVLVLAWAAWWGLARRSGGYTYWRGVFLVLLGVGLVGFLPAKRTVPVTFEQPSVAEIPPIFEATAPQPHAALAPPISESAGNLGSGRTLPIPAAIVGIWAVGTIVLLLRLVAQWIVVGRWVRAAHPVVTGRARILVSDRVASPVAVGFFRATILVPPAFVTWPVGERRMALRHERVHVRRRDGAWQLLAAVVVAFHWPNPLAWLALRQLARHREVSADAEVVRSGVSPRHYADFLVRLASGEKAPAFALPMARKSTVPMRVGRLLDGNSAGKVAAAPLVWLALGLLAGIAVTLGVTSFLANERPLDREVEVGYESDQRTAVETQIDGLSNSHVYAPDTSGQKLAADAIFVLKVKIVVLPEEWDDPEFDWVRSAKIHRETARVLPPGMSDRVDAWLGRISPELIKSEILAQKNGVPAVFLDRAFVGMSFLATVGDQVGTIDINVRSRSRQSSFTINDGYTAALSRLRGDGRIELMLVTAGLSEPDQDIVQPRNPPPGAEDLMLAIDATEIRSADPFVVKWSDFFPAPALLEPHDGESGFPVLKQEKSVYVGILSGSQFALFRSELGRRNQVDIRSIVETRVPGGQWVKYSDGIEPALGVTPKIGVDQRSRFTIELSFVSIGLLERTWSAFEIHDGRTVIVGRRDPSGENVLTCVTVRIVNSDGSFVNTLPSPE
ncbi:hypothetical protein BH23VER1_BH23VER1_08280 [soil metagenome]